MLEDLRELQVTRARIGCHREDFVGQVRRA
jgi:hypothetical protein